MKLVTPAALSTVILVAAFRTDQLIASHGAYTLATASEYGLKDKRRMSRFAYLLLPILLISSSMAMSEARVVKAGSPDIHLGDSRIEIRSVIGEPMKVEEIQKTGEDLWIYNFGNVTTTLILENGHVTGMMQSFDTAPSHEVLQVRLAQTKPRDLSTY